MTNPHPLLLNIENQIATITFNRPDKHHAFDEHFIRFFTDTLLELNTNNQIKALVIKSTGKSFSSGADLNWMQRMAEFDFEQNEQDAVMLDKLMYTLADMSMPTIALVQGACYGGALGLIACCNIVLASDKAKFCFSEAKLGLIPAVISPYVIRATNNRFATKMFLTAELFDANQALTANLCHEVIAHETLENRGNEIIGHLLNNGPGALRAISALTKALTPLPNESIRQSTAQMIAHIRASSEAKDGMQAFFAKRKPSWIK